MLALITGRGALPRQIADAQEVPPLVCALEGFEADDLDPDIIFRLETLGSLLVTLGERGVTDVCLAGSIERPIFNPAFLDEETKPLVPILQAALGDGDDGALRAVMSLFEATGFTIRGAHELVPDLVAPPGVLSEKWPDAGMRADAARGADILAALAPLDVGQACVVGGGQVLGIETIAGTDHMLKTLVRSELRSRAVLVKGPKLGQDSRADMPTVGPGTIKAIKSAGLAGLVVDAGDVIMLDQDGMIKAANEAGLVLWSRRGD